LHALGLCPEAYSNFGERMAELGMDTTAVEVRGFGATRNRPGYEDMDPEETVGDLVKLLQGIREREPNKKIFLIGESMGGALAIRVAATHPELVDGIACSAPAWQLHKIRRILAKGICDLFTGVGVYRLNDIKYSAEAVIRQATSSPEVRQHWRKDGMTKLGLKIPEAWRYYQFMKTTPGSAEKISGVPILIVQGLKDRLSKAHGAAELYSKLTTSQKQLAIVGNREHLVFEEGMMTDETAEFVQHWVLRQMAEQSARKDDFEIEPIVVLGSNKLSSADKKKLQELVKLSGATPKHLAITKPPVRE
jgi:Lysophospholipase